MASRKEYEGLFRLNAQLGGNFSGAFKSAQSELSTTQKEIQALNRIQSDISAYQKQQAAVENTKKKLETLQQQYDNIQREIKETEGFSSDLENKLLSKQQQIDKTTHSLEQQTDKLHQMDSALREAKVDTGHLEAESAKLGTQIDDLRAKQDQAAHSAGLFGEKSSAVFGAIQQAMAAAGVAAALHEIYEGYMECVTVSGDFEESVSTVKALSGAEAKELESLSAMAKELGATTKFTAKESADAMTYMAMAGWDANDMLSGMDGVLQLAAASGEDLAQVSDIVTDNLSAFGLKASDTAHFSDVLAAAATNANTNVSIMGETFKMSASVAGALGYSVEDVAVAVGLMANSGVKGSIAGTALKNTFNGLLEGVTLTGAAFGEYEYSAVRVDGTMKSFGSTIEELRGYFNQMTEAERVNNAMTIAGERGYNGLLAILNATDEDYASLTASINNCSGAAAKMAAIKMDNMNGQLTLAKSAWDALKMSVGDQFTPVMRKAYEIEAKVFNGLSKFVEKHPTLIKAIAAVVAVVGTATAALTAYAAIKKVVNALNLIPLVSGAGPIVAVIAAVAGLTAGIVALASATNTEEEELAALSATSREQYAQMRDLQDQYEEVCAAMGDTSYEAQILKQELNEATSIYENNKQTMEEWSAAQRAAIDAHKELMTAYSDSEIGIEKEAQSNENLILKLEELMEVEGKSAATKQEILTIVEMLNEAMPELGLAYDQYENSLNMTADALRAVIEAEVAREKNAADIDHLKKLISEEAGLYDVLQSSIAETTAAEKELADAKAAMAEKQKSLGTPAGEAGGREYALAMMPYIEAVKRAENAVDAAKVSQQEAQDAYNENQQAIDELTSTVAGYTENVGESNQIIDGILASVQTLSESYNEAYRAAYDSVSGQYNLWDKAAEVAATSAITINASLESQITYWQDYNANLKSLGDRAGDIEGLSDMLASFADGSAESVNAVSGMASASDEDLRTMVSNWQTLQQEQENVAGSVADMKTDFTATMDELQHELAADIEAMDLGTEAAESAMATIQGFIDGATDMLPQVQAAYARIANTARSALHPGGTTGSSIPGYAVGTQSAAPGFAMVGEHGPELVYFNGGEQVMTAAETAAMRDRLSFQAVAFAPQLLEAMSAMGNANRPYAQTISAASESKAPVSIQITFDINGNVTPETVESLRIYGDDFADRVLEVLADAGVDAARRKY